MDYMLLDPLLMSALRQAAHARVEARLLRTLPNEMEFVPNDGYFDQLEPSTEQHPSSNFNHMATNNGLRHVDQNPVFLQNLQNQSGDAPILPPVAPILPPAAPILPPAAVVELKEAFTQAASARKLLQNALRKLERAEDLLQQASGKCPDPAPAKKQRSKRT